ncbi:MAG TPA: phosphate acyltransferase, partial [Acidocella sp.]|nr:phosphate acyltransferase [Acidocella sp.]
MSQSSKLAVDAMGGDHAPEAIIAGLDIAADRQPRAFFLIFGDEARLKPLLAASKRLAGRHELRHCAEIITGDMKPTVGLRLRDSSMR